jgi:hypothetical protein
MLAIPASQEKDKDGARGGRPSVIHIRQREGQQSWLSVRHWEFTPSFGDCRVHAIRALVPELVTKELGALFVCGFVDWGSIDGRVHVCMDGLLP